MEAAARLARYHAIGQWLRRSGLKALFVGHTRDDQAETLLLRLARGSGLDGLAAMRPIASYPVAEFRDLVLVRPLLDFSREQLRAHLKDLGQHWIDDPMNRDPRFGRVRIRESWDALESLGLTKGRLADAAAHLMRAREALDAVTLALLAGCSRMENGSALVDREALTQAPRELALRALASLLMVVSGQGYRPRFDGLERLFARLAEDGLGGGCTLHFCRIRPAPRAQAVFGSGTVLIQQETARR